MDVEDLLENAKDLPSYEFERRLNKLVRDNYRYRNLDSKNREIVLDLIKKYQNYLQKGIGVSSSTLRNEMYRLRKNRLKLDLTEEDLDDIEEIIYMFKK